MSQTLRAHLQFPKPRFPHAGCAAADRGGHSEKYRPRKDRCMSVRLFAVLLAAFALCGVPAAGQDEAAALLAKHKAYVGWEFGDGTFKTLRIEGTASRLGKDGKPKPIWTFVDARRGIIHRESWKSLETGGESVSGFTGSTFWYSDENGFTVPIVSETLKTDLAEAVLFNEATTVYPATVIRRDAVNAKPVVVLQEKMPTGTLMELSIDPQTGAYARAV